MHMGRVLFVVAAVASVASWLLLLVCPGPPEQASINASMLAHRTGCIIWGTQSKMQMRSQGDASVDKVLTFAWEAHVNPDGMVWV